MIEVLAETSVEAGTTYKTCLGSIDHGILGTWPRNSTVVLADDVERAGGGRREPV